MMRDDSEPAKRPPYVTVALLLGAVICQSLVLKGNLHTVHNLHRLGSSSGGWAATGMNLAESFGDFSTSLFRTSKTMAYVVEDILVIESALDALLLNVSEAADQGRPPANVSVGAGGSSPDTDSFIQVHLSINSEEDLATEPSVAAEAADAPRGPRTLAAAADPQSPCGKVLRAAEPALRELRPKMRELLRKLVPVLKQIRRWLNDLSDRVQSYVGHFGITMGKAQEIFDVVTDSFGSSLTSDAEMIDQTYSLFDTSGTGLVSLWDLGNVSQMFGIPFLQGKRVVDMFHQYDSDGDHMLDQREFGQMMLDPSTPEMMATVLHTYADKLAQVSGPLKRSETRAEVAKSVASYLQVVVSKNMTKVGWMAQALTNGSLPLNFTVAVLNQLALVAEDPNKMTVVETGGILVKRMVDFSPSAVRRALEFMVDPEEWAREGLDPELQPAVIERVARWAAAAGAEGGSAVCAVLVGPAHSGAEVSFSEGVGILEKETQALPAFYRWRAERGARARAASVRTARARTTEALLGSATSRILLEDLLGVVLPASMETSPEAERAVQKGQPAAPEVLQFAEWLGNNASRTAATLTSKCFDYSARMSHNLQGLVGKVRGVSDKVSMALQFMTRFTGRASVDEIVESFEAFTANATEELVAVCDRIVEGSPMLGSVHVSSGSSWSRVVGMLREMADTLPGVIDGMEVAQMNAASFSSSLNSIFEVMIDKLPMSFHWSARFWRTFWVTYYVLFLLIDAAMLFWILWVSGCLASDKASEDAAEEYRPPQTTRERLEVFWASCNVCMRERLVDRTLCFWSILLIIELFVFVAFIFTLLLSVFAMVKIFIHSGCNQLYMLGDLTVCTEVMTNIKVWLQTFLNRDFLTPLTVCDERMLLTCQLISNDLVTSSIFTVVGGFLGAFFNFQVIIEAAILHERARWHLAMKAPRTEL